MHKPRIFSLILLLAVLLTSCSAAPTPAPTTTLTLPPPATNTPAPTNTPQPSATPLPPTATRTATITPSATTAPTKTPTLALAAENGLQAWCVSVKDANPQGGTPTMPAYGRLGKVANSVLNLNIGGGSCTFVFTFNQAAPADAELQVLDVWGKEAWIKAKLTSVNGAPQKAWVTLTQTMINNPPYWETSFPFRLAAGGAEQWKSSVRLYKTMPLNCWEGSTPDPVTLRCPVEDGDYEQGDYPTATVTPDKK